MLVIGAGLGRLVRRANDDRVRAANWVRLWKALNGRRYDHKSERQRGRIRFHQADLRRRTKNPIAASPVPRSTTLDGSGTDAVKVSEVIPRISTV